MARIGVDYTQVSKAAFALVEAGQTPTVDNVRTQLGGTGSKSTIGPLLKRWKTENVHSVNHAHSGLPEDLLESVRRLFESVQDRFQDELAAAELTAASRIAELQDNVVKLQEQLVKCEDRDRLLNDELTEQASCLNTVRSELGAERKARRDCDLACASLKQRLGERSSEIAHLREQIDQAHQQFEHFVAAAQARWDEEQKKNEAKINAQMQADQRLRDELRVAQDELLTKAVQLEQISASHEQVLLQSKGIQSALNELQQQNARMDEQTNTLQQQLEQRTATLADLQQRHDFALARAVDAEKRLAVSESKQALLRTGLSAAEQHADTLLDDKLAQLRQAAELEASLQQCRQELMQFKKS